MTPIDIELVPRVGSLADELRLAAQMYQFNRFERSRSEIAAIRREERRRLNPKATTTEIVTIRRHSAIGTSAMQIRRAFMPHLPLEEVEKYVVAP